MFQGESQTGARYDAENTCPLLTFSGARSQVKDALVGPAARGHRSETVAIVAQGVGVRAVVVVDFGPKPCSGNLSVT